MNVTNKNLTNKGLCFLNLIANNKTDSNIDL